MEVSKNILLIGVGIAVTIVIILMTFLLFQNTGMNMSLVDGSTIKVNNFLKNENNTVRDSDDEIIIQSYQDVGSLSYFASSESFLLKIDGTTINAQEKNLTQFQTAIKQLLGVNEKELCLLPISILNYDIDNLVFPVCRQPDSM